MTIYIYVCIMWFVGPNLLYDWYINTTSLSAYMHMLMCLGFALAAWGYGRKNCPFSHGASEVWIVRVSLQKQCRLVSRRSMVLRAIFPFFPTFSWGMHLCWLWSNRVGCNTHYIPHIWILYIGYPIYPIYAYVCPTISQCSFPRILIVNGPSSRR